MNWFSSRAHMLALSGLSCLVGVLLSPAYSMAQDGHAPGSDTLEYYLVQAFEAAEPKERIALNHIGIEARQVDEGWLVTAALEGYPAHQVGIERGDRIVRADGESFHPLYSFNSSNGESLAFNPAVRSYHLEFERLDALQSVDITPVFENLFDSYRTATVDSAQAFPLGNKTIGYIRFWGLSRSTADLFTLSLIMQDFRDSDGMILDLRDSYGYLSQQHLDLFIRNDSGNFNSSDPTNMQTSLGKGLPDSQSQPFTKPVVVLLNSQTRGGAELFAYGLSKLGRITTLGETSKGELGGYRFDGGSLIYQSADELLIDDRPLESKGVIPEVEISYPYSQSGRSDPQFEAAVDFLLGII